MPSNTPLSSHPMLQNFFLILISLFFLPILTTVTLLSTFISPWLASTKHINHTRTWRSLSSSTFRPRTVLITSLRTPESLSLARTFYRAGHRVIGADYEEYYFPIPAHFSRAVVFYRLANGKGKKGSERYVRDLVDAVKKEKVEIWVNCGSGDEGREMKEVLEKETRCKVFQLRGETLGLLGDQVAFGEHVEQLGLNVVERHFVTSETEALAILYPEKEDSGQGKQYTIQNTSIKDPASSEMTPLPLSPPNDIKVSIKTLRPSPTNPLILQEFFPDNLQYTADTLITNSKPAAFVAYPTSTTLLTPLPSTSLLTQSLVKYTTHLTASLAPGQTTGNLTLTFTLPSHLSIPAETHFGASSSTVTSFLPTSV